MTYQDEYVDADYKSTVRSVEGEVEPVPNEPNKAIVTVVGLIAGVIAQWAISQGFDIDQEGITAILVPVLGWIVYKVSNQTKLF